MSKDILTKNETALGDVTRNKTPGDVAVGLTAVEALAKAPVVVRIGDISIGTSEDAPVLHAAVASKVHSAVVLADADVTADDTNYAIIKLVNKADDGDGTEVVATIDTKVAGGGTISDFVGKALGSITEGVGATKTLIDRVSPNTLKIDAKTKGRAGNLITITITDGTLDATNEFNLTVKVSTVEVESWPNLSMEAAEDNYVGKIVSDYIILTDLYSASAAPTNRPAVQADTALLTGANGAYLDAGDVLSLVVDEDTGGNGIGITGLTLVLSVSPVVEGLLA